MERTGQLEQFRRQQYVRTISERKLAPTTVNLEAALARLETLAAAIDRGR